MPESQVLIESQKRKELLLRQVTDRVTLILGQVALSGKEHEQIAQLFSSLYVEWRNAWTQEHAVALTEQLQQAGVNVRVQHFTGDNSFPTEHTISIGTIGCTGPTFDIVLAGFIQQLLKQERSVLRECKVLLDDFSQGNWNERRDRALARIAAIIGEDEEHLRRMT